MPQLQGKLIRVATEQKCPCGSLKIAGSVILRTPVEAREPIDIAIACRDVSVQATGDGVDDLDGEGHTTTMSNLTLSVAQSTGRMGLIATKRW